MSDNGIAQLDRVQIATRQITTADNNDVKTVLVAAVASSSSIDWPAPDTVGRVRMSDNKSSPHFSVEIVMRWSHIN